MVEKLMPNWVLNPGTVLLCTFAGNKGDTLCDKVHLKEAKPSFARFRFTIGLKSTVSAKD